MKSHKKDLAKKTPRKGDRGYDSRLDRDMIPQSLPQLQDQLAVAITLRFVTTEAFAGQFSVTPYNLLDAWFIAGQPTAAYQLFDFVRVKRVTIRALGGIYSASSATKTPMTTVGVEFFGLSSGTYGGGKQKSDSALGLTYPAMVSLAPDPKSQVAQFQPVGGSSMFAVRAVDQGAQPIVGAVIDVDVVYRNSADVNPAAVAVARAGLTAGEMYFGGLDGNPLATTAARSVFNRRA